MSTFIDYLSAIRKEHGAGDATEHTHRPALKTLLESAGKGITATNEPKRILCGSPDFQVVRKAVPLGHVETKDIGTNLDEMERGKGAHGEQFTRYRDGLPNWLLTDYLQFRWFVGGEKRLSVRIAELDAKGKLKPLPDGERELAELLTAFFEQPALTVASARELARRMAGMTGIIRDLIVGTFEHEKEQGWLHNWLAAFRETLIPDLDEKQFADMFAQTLAYGLFAARVHAPPGKPFSRELAAYNLPKTNPFLRKLFAEIAGVNMPDSLAWAVDDVVELLKHADMAEILTDFGKGKGKEDPVVHFYETFLAAYDPKMREVRGVYYTPEPVVSYIVRSIDHLLKTRFNRPKGLADEKTLILDPATGTATFLYFVIDQIRRKFAKQAGAWDDYVAKHLLNRVFGFELLMAPYAVAHLKLGMQLQETGYRFASDQRLGIYLTNTLEEAANKSEKLFAGWVAEEANAAAEIKRDKPILVVLGNPPYSGHSANRSEVEVFVPAGKTYTAETKKGPVERVAGKLGARVKRKTFIGRLIEDYKEGCPELYKPAQAKWLHDDYVKFIRFAQWRISKTGEGIVGFITNHGYLDNPTFRGMRQSLMRNFNEIYVYDLHGNTKKKERAPDGREDNNVFDIQQGVAILLCVKEKGNAKPAIVHHADMWGTRESKYECLTETDAHKTAWEELKPAETHYLFVPQDGSLRAEYDGYLPITDAMRENGDPAPGIVTTHDEFAISWSRNEGTTKVLKLLRTATEAEARALYRLCGQSQWNYERAKKELSSDEWRKQIGQVYYRPFDCRWTVYNPNVAVHRRLRASRHFIGCERVPIGSPNVGLCVGKAGQVVGSGQWNLICCTRLPVDFNLFYRGGACNLPLYLYPAEADVLGLRKDCRPNLSPAFLKALAGKLDLPQRGPHGLPRGVTPEDIFHYAYAVFHSLTYRTRYAEFLKIDFPRLPLTSDVKLFRPLAAKGAELVALHLLESPKLEDFLTDWPVKGDNVVEKVQYTEKDGRVWINKTQYFAGVPKAVWEFQIGGYHVCHKWLKDRKGRKLTYEDTQHYQKIVVALNETIRLMTEIDEVVGQHGGWPIQ